MLSINFVFSLLNRTPSTEENLLLSLFTSINSKDMQLLNEPLTFYSLQFFFFLKTPDFIIAAEPTPTIPTAAAIRS